MKRFILALLGLLLSVSAHAVPTLQGTLISAVTTDQARYQPGALAHVMVTLTNGTGTVFAGTLIGVMTGRGQTVSTVTAATPSISSNGTATIDLAFPIPTGLDFRGYFVALTAKNGGGSVVDTAASALDLSSDWAVYPRECFVTNFAAGINTANLAKGLVAWHCNILQFYDANYKHHQPYSPAASWANLSNTQINRTTVASYIGEAHARGMAVFNYTLWNGAYPNYATDGTGAQLSWGMFATNCSPSCALANQTGTPSTGGAGALFPSSWSALWLAEMDPTNTGWINYFEAVNAPVIKALGYDGLQIDTLGNPGTVYNSTGSAITLTTSLSAFQNAVSTALRTRGVINNVSRWAEADVAANAKEDFYYSEIHPEFGDTATFPAINGATATIRGFSSGLGINLAMYMDSTYSNTPSCQSGGGATICYFNLPGMLYADATMFAAGAYHMYLADGDRFVSNIYIPGPQLSMTGAAVQAEYDYQNFGVAYEKILRNVVSDDGAHAATITSGATGSAVGAAGAVYVLPKSRSGLQILHLLNYSQASTNNNQDLTATILPPTQLTNVAIKMYYGGSVSNGGKLWLASPDIAHGAPAQIAYTTGSDGGGTFITFTVPSLLYWDMLWLELNAISASDYATP